MARDECWYSGGRLVWMSDFDYADVYGEGEGIVTYLTCQSCGAEGVERITLRCSMGEGNWPFYVLHGFCIVGEKAGDYEMELKLEEYLD